MEQSKWNILNNFFSRNTFHNCMEIGADEMYEQVIKRYVADSNKGKTNAALISEVYNLLKQEYRNEYFYKNTLLNKWLLGVHSINTTTALTEISIADSKADFILINGKAVVYEIKTGLDNLCRLKKQLRDYYKAFDHVAVVTCAEQLPLLEQELVSFERPVGIYVLRKRGTLSMVRRPECFREDLDAGVLFTLLHKREYENILLKCCCSLPNVSEFKYYLECKKMFLKLPIDTVYEEVLKQLKNRTRIEQDDFEQIPYELKFLVYFMNLRKKNYQSIMSFLNAVYEGD